MNMTLFKMNLMIFLKCICVLVKVIFILDTIAFILASENISIRFEFMFIFNLFDKMEKKEGYVDKAVRENRGYVQRRTQSVRLTRSVSAEVQTVYQEFASVKTTITLDFMEHAQKVTVKDIVFFL